MLDEFQRRNFAPGTIRYYIRTLREFTAYFRKPPDRLGVEEFVGAIPECLSHPNFY
jgi:hypothetical protein